MKTFVVTGGAGFIGSHIVERLLRDGHRVRILDNFLTGTRDNIAHLASYGDALSIHETSVTDLAALRPIFDGAEVVYHQAALPSVPRSVANPLETHEHSVTGTLNVLLAARDAGVRRVIYAASSAAYGDTDEITHEDMPPNPISPYGVAKLAGEYYCRMFTSVYGLETVCLRYFNVFGARQDPRSQYAAVIPIFITAMLKGESPTIYGDGLQSRDFIHIENVVHGNLLASDAPEAAGHVMNLATGTRITLLELVERLNRLLGTNIAPIHEAPRPGDIRHSGASIQRAQDLLDFSPVIDLDTALARTIDWYRTNGR
ncbi:MAG: SDR family oxidoreductase [bacterium]|nr:SDR family oxidoreductase [bacterium]